MNNPLRIGEKTFDKVLHFTYKGKDYELGVQLDRGAVDFFAHYPNTDLEVYFDAPLSPMASHSLMTALKPVVAGLSETEAINLLLRFVQTAFDYQIDAQQFGKEKTLFPEETLFYSTSDCEDRSILFAYLVQELLGLEVVGLDYPGHVATAVRFRESAAGDYVLYRGGKYIISRSRNGV